MRHCITLCLLVLMLTGLCGCAATKGDSSSETASASTQTSAEELDSPEIAFRNDTGRDIVELYIGTAHGYSEDLLVSGQIDAGGAVRVAYVPDEDKVYSVRFVLADGTEATVENVRLMQGGVASLSLQTPEEPEV